MKKPDNARGFGVRLHEMELAASEHARSPDSGRQYLAFLLFSAVEKLKCIKQSKFISTACGIVDREEWVDEESQALFGESK